VLLGMKRRGVNLTTPYARLTDPEHALLWHGDGAFEGIHQYFEYLEGKRYKVHVRVLLSRYRSRSPCTACGESRLRPEARWVRIAGSDIHHVSTLTVDEAMAWVVALRLSDFEGVVARDVLHRLRDKLRVLQRVGLGHRALCRLTRTLSGGEAQRIGLANQFGSRPAGTL
jgi:excinuclease ABC subunit A